MSPPGWEAHQAKFLGVLKRLSTYTLLLAVSREEEPLQTGLQEPRQTQARLSELHGVWPRCGRLGPPCGTSTAQ